MCDVVAIDDDEDLLTVLRSFGQCGAHPVDVEGYPPSPSAWAAMERSPEAPVILDLMMPGHDGIATARAIRQRWPGRILIAYTAAHEGTPIVEEARRSGLFDTVVQKPSTPDAIRYILRILAVGGNLGQAARIAAAVVAQRGVPFWRRVLLRG